MQPRSAPAKPKYRLRDYAAPGNSATCKSTFIATDSSCKLFCLCNQFNIAKCIKCIRCGELYHNCVNGKSEKVQEWQCLPCESKYMDPIYWPQTVLLQTFFKTQPVFQYCNIVQFYFTLNTEQIKKPLQVRGLQDGKSGLAWPMQGQIYLNKQQNAQPIVDFKPLLKNSNRKNRREESLILPPDKLKVGKNVLAFTIPRLASVLFQGKYQVQQRNIYFFGIYAIKKYEKQELIQKVFQTSKIDKAGSLEWLRRGEGELSISKVKLSLQCPFMKSRIKIPIRGKKCTHYMVICLDTLIQTRLAMNNREWQCPICNSDINEPIIDMYILSILNDGSAGIEIQMDMDGNYRWVAFQDDNVSLSSDGIPQKINKKNNQEKAPVRTIKTGIAKQSQPKIVSSEKQKTIEPINLDDDEQVPPIQQLTSKNQDIMKKTPKAAQVPLQIMIPKQKPKFDKQKQIKEIREQLKQNIKEKQRKKKQIDIEVSKTRREQFLITDIQEMQFRQVNFNQFVKKYFNIGSKIKINDDVKNIFKEVI